MALSVAGATVLLLGGMAGLAGRSMFAAAQDTSGAAVVNRARTRQAVRVKATGAPVKATSLIVPLHQHGASAGELAALDKEGKPVGQCALKHTDVKADVAGFVARVTVTQQYQNPFTEPIEAVYTFPLPEDAAVDSMEMRIGERLIQGDIKRREEARQIYEAAKSAGQAAALLDQERPNIFTQSVANVMPGQDVTITISYVNTLKYEDGRYELVFPMVVGPRFIPGGGGYTQPGKRGDPSPVPVVGADPGKTPVVTDADRITPPITPPGTRSGHDISLAVNLDAGLPLKDVSSVLHDVDVARDGDTRATVKLANEATIPNKDFILRYTVGGAGVQTGMVTHSDGGAGYFTLILQPPAAPKPAQIASKEMVFVIDQTGSQMGWPIAKAKETMKHAINNLNPGDTFQLIGFNTSVYPCFEKPVPATPANIRKAIAYLDPLEGGGGTDILKAADYALRLPEDPARPRIICFMTDGYVGNDMQIIDYVKKNRGRARIFPFGIGNGVNRFLIEGMAREGRGQAEFVTLDEPGTAAAERFYNRIANPVLLDPKVDWHGLPVEDVYPKTIPDVFASAPIVLKGRFTRPAEGDVTVSGLLGGKPWTQEVHVVFPPEQVEGAGLESLWARARIEDLQARDWIGAQTGNPDQQVKDEIVQTALEHRLMSQYTSFVAVEKRVVNVGGKQRTVDVPVEMPEGVAYEGIFGEDKLAANGLVAARRQVLAAGTGTAYYSAPAAAPRAAEASMGGFGGLATKSAPIPAQTRPAPASPPVAATDAVSVDAPMLRDSDITQDTVAGREQLAKMTPAQRRAALRAAKLAKPLQDLAAVLKKDGKDGTLRKKGYPEVDRGRVTVQVWLNDLPADGLKQLKALGFDVAATLTPKLLLGTVAVDRLDALIALGFVRRVEPPAFR